MNRSFRASLGITALTLGLSLLAGCHDTREENPNGIANYQDYLKEQDLIAKLKANPQDYQALADVAELRGRTDRERVARYNFAQILAADSTNNPELEGLKAQAEIHMAILKATYEGKAAIADTGFQFNLKRADDVLKGDEK